MSEMLEHFPVTSSSVLSNTAVETVALYNAGTAYAVGDFSRRPNDRVYLSLANSNTGNTPESSSDDFWADYGPANKVAIFDGSYRTQMTATSSLAFSIQGVGYVDSVALLNLTGNAARVVVKDASEAVVYDETHSLLDDDPIVDIWSYFFEPLENIPDLYISQIPATADPVIENTITGPGAVGIGLWRGGLSVDIGGSQYGSTFGLTRWSRPEYDDYGNYKPVIRPSAKRGNWDMFVGVGRARALFRKFEAVDITPMVFRMMEDDSRGIGFFQIDDFEFTRAHPEHDRYRLSLKAAA